MNGNDKLTETENLFFT